MAAIALDGITKRFGSTTALRDVSVSVDDGEFLALLGPSGCGKSTLLRIVAGLTSPDAGRVVIDGRDVTGLRPQERDLAMVFQSYALYPHLSVARNLGFGLRVRRRPRQEVEAKVASVAGLLKLEELLDRRPSELSGGQRQRVALGRAIVREPRAFLMDEPLSNLDAQLRTATRLELAALHRRLGATFVFVTHDQVEAMTMATRIVVLNGGRVEQVGTPSAIYDEPATSFVAGFIGAPAMNLVPASLVSVGGVIRVRARGIEVPLWEGSLEERRIVLGIRPEHLRLAAPHDPARLRGLVSALENLGSEEVAFCDVGGAQVAVRGPRPLSLGVGEAVDLTVTAEQVHLFDPVSTRRLEWVTDGAAGPVDTVVYARVAPESADGA